MIPYAEGRFNSSNAIKFYIKPSKYKNCWEYYYKQYLTAFDYLLRNAILKHYSTNCQFMSFMFLFRHSVELLLKYVISISKTDVPQTHILSKLTQNLDERFKILISSLPHLYPETDGLRYRYYVGKDGMPFFNKSEILDVIDDCNVFIQFCNSDSSLLHFQNAINPNDKKLKHELSFYTNECHGLGIVRTHYDFTLDTLICGITNDDLSVNEVYLPILFLVRHGIELAIKNNLLDLGNVLSYDNKIALNNEHNLFQLYKILAKYVDEAIKQIPIGEKFRDESENYNSTLIKLKNLIHKFDTNSYAFRYPYDKKLKFKKEEVLSALQLYYETDAFLSNAVMVLCEEGYLTIGDDVLYQLLQ